MRTSNSWIRSPSHPPPPPTLTGSFEEALMLPITNEKSSMGESVGGGSQRNQDRALFSSQTTNQKLIVDHRETIASMSLKSISSLPSPASTSIENKENSKTIDHSTASHEQKQLANTNKKTPSKKEKATFSVKSIEKNKEKNATPTPFWKLGVDTSNSARATQASKVEKTEEQVQRKNILSPSEATLESSLASQTYQEGKAFWLQFLEPSSNHQSESVISGTSASDALGPVWRSRRTSTGTHCTPLGTTIQRTQTSGSPLSEASSYLADEEGSHDDSCSTEFRVSSPPKDSVDSEGKPRSNATEISTTKQSKNEEEDSSSALAQETMRKKVPTSTVESAKKLFEQKVKEEMKSDKLRLEQLKPKDDLFSPPAKSSSVKNTIATFWERSAGKSKSTSSTIRKGDAASSVKSINSAPNASKNSSMKAVTAIETNIVEPKKSDKFNQAYNAWYRAGLMKHNVVESELPFNLSTAEKIEVDESDDEEDDIKKAKAEVVANAIKLARDSLGSASDKEMLDLAEEAGTPRFSSTSPKAAATPEAEREFFNILQRWQKKTEDRPHPDDSSGAEKPERNSSVEDIFRQNSDDARLGILKRIQTFDKDDFDFVRESEKKESLSVSEAEEDRVEDRAGKKGNQETRVVDSDNYEDALQAEYEEGNRALVILENKNAYQIVVGDSCVDANGNGLKIKNVELVTSNQRERQLTQYESCEGSISTFNGNDDLISFFLPQMGMESRVFMNPEDPMAIENVLRPWQVEFCKSFGIHRGEQLVKARHRSGGMLAKALRQWRKKEGLTPFKTTSCGMAIDIWAKTCKVYVRSIRKQLSAGKDLLDRRPQEVINEIHQFLGNLPSAPERRRDPNVVHIEPESEMEV